MKKPTFDLVLSKNRPHLNGTYPLSLRVTYERIPNLIGLGISLKEDEFNKIWKSKTPRNESLTKKIKLQKEFIQKSYDIIDQMEREGVELFDFKEFKARFNGKKLNIDSNLLCMYDRVITEYASNDQISTSENYRNSKAALVKFINPKNGEIKFNSLKTKDLRDIENYMIVERKLSPTTLSMYLRCLKTVYNKAISGGIISHDISPFNSKIDHYVIPMVRNVKKALGTDEINRLADYYDFENSPRCRARDFWMLSFYCYGMNICDILQLKNNNLDGNVLHFYRQKTMNSHRGNQKPVQMSLKPNAMEIIDKYRNPDQSPDKYLFDELDHKDSAIIKRKKIKKFTRFINQHIKKIAIIIGIDPKVSTYYARHSFATIARNNGTEVEKISLLMAHSNISTTQKYLDSLNLEQSRAISDNIYRDF